MKRYSEIFQLGSMMFRYDYENAVVELVFSPTEEDKAINREWVEKYNKPLFELSDGLIVADAIGLSRENWEDPEAREEYLDSWAEELNEYSAWCAEEFM